MGTAEDPRGMVQRSRGSYHAEERMRRDGRQDVLHFIALKVIALKMGGPPRLPGSHEEHRP